MDFDNIEWDYDFYQEWKEENWDWLLKEMEERNKTTKGDFGLILDN